MSAHETTVTVIGESLIDIICNPHRQGSSQTHPGGSPLNVAVGAARLNLGTTLVTDYASDPHGIAIERHLRENGVRPVNERAAPTSTATATIGPDRAASYTFSITWDLNATSEPTLAAIAASTHIHTGSIAAALQPGANAALAVIAAARQRATVSYDPNCRPAVSPDQEAARVQAEAFVAASDIVKASDDDLHWLYPDRAPVDTLEAWLALGPSVIALTRGAGGTVVLSRNGRVDVAAGSVAIADTVGAGDSFMAALISGLSQLDVLGAENRARLNNLGANELRALAAYANRAAAITCSGQGANPPRMDELGPLNVDRPDR
jgi:fructokinase